MTYILPCCLPQELKDKNENGEEDKTAKKL